MTDEPKNNGEKTALQDPTTGKFLPGNPGGGRPKGTKNFSTIFDEVIKEIAAANGVSEESVEKDLLKMAVKSAREGNFQYFKDLMDRRYGQPRQKIDMGLDEDIKEIKVEIVK